MKIYKQIGLIESEQAIQKVLSDFNSWFPECSGGDPTLKYPIISDLITKKADGTYTVDEWEFSEETKAEYDKRIKEEAEAERLLDPVEQAKDRVAEIPGELSNLDFKSIRPARALEKIRKDGGDETEERDYLISLENQAIALRAELSEKKAIAGIV